MSAIVRNGNFDVNAAAAISGQNVRATGTTDNKFNHRYKVSGSNVRIKPLLDRFGIKVAGMEQSDLVTDFNANIYGSGANLNTLWNMRN